MSENKKKHLFQVMIETALQASEAISKDFSSRKKPVVRVIVYFGTLLIMIIALPIVVSFKLFRKKIEDPFLKLRTELEAKWSADSNHDALIALRDVYSRLISNQDTVFLKGFKIAPYGKFRFYEYIRVAHLLYHWELQHQNWNEANKICDEILNLLSDVDPKKNKSYEDWIVYKARAIKHLEGETAAQEFLLKYVDPKRDDSPVNTYLFELRNAG